MLEIFLVGLIFAHLNLGALLLNKRSDVSLQPVTIEYQQQQVQQQRVVLKRKPQPVTVHLFRFFLKTNQWFQSIAPPLPARAPPVL